MLRPRFLRQISARVGTGAGSSCAPSGVTISITIDRCLCIIMIISVSVTITNYSLTCKWVPLRERHPGSGSVREMAGATRNPAPRNHFLAWIVKPSGCHCTDAFGGNKYRRVPIPLRTPLRSTSPFSESGRIRGIQDAGFGMAGYAGERVPESTRRVGPPWLGKERA